MSNEIKSTELITLSHTKKINENTISAKQKATMEAPTNSNMAPCRNMINAVNRSLSTLQKVCGYISTDMNRINKMAKDFTFVDNKVAVSINESKK